MRDSHDLNVVAAYAIHDEERKAAQQYASCITEVRRTGVGSPRNQFDRPIELPLKTSGRDLVSFAVPSLGSLRFVGSKRMEFDRELGHQRAASRRRTSAQGMVLTAPLSSSATRRFTSVAQAASASSSTSVSRLSSNDPASAARASVGCARASFRISAASRFIFPF